MPRRDHGGKEELFPVDAGDESGEVLSLSVGPAVATTGDERKEEALSVGWMLWDRGCRAGLIAWR
jgi:hypothetical protein